MLLIRIFRIKKQAQRLGLREAAGDPSLTPGAAGKVSNPGIWLRRWRFSETVLVSSLFRALSGFRRGVPQDRVGGRCAILVVELGRRAMLKDCSI